jgi:hypothetical protein
LIRHLPNLRPTKFATLAAGGALCLATAGSAAAVTLPAASGGTAAASVTDSSVTDSTGATATSARLTAATIADAEAAHAAVRAAVAARVAATKGVKATRVASAAQSSGSPQEVAQRILASDGMAGQFSCLDSLWERESGWNVDAENPTTGAYGIPQALPGSKMAGAGPDWQSDAATQIEWGLSYIDSRYGSPCGAWAHEEADGWY